MAKVLAIDYGARKIGIAESDPDRVMAFGRTVLKNDAQWQSRVAEMIEGVDQIVMGVPLAADGEDTEQSLKIKGIGAQLQELTGLPVDYIDESFSTFQAQQELHSLGVDARKQKESEDEMAAILILQKYIGM